MSFVSSTFSFLYPHLLLMAESSDQGMLVAPSTRIPSLSFPTPKNEKEHEPVNQGTRIQNLNASRISLVWFGNLASEPGTLF